MNRILYFLSILFLVSCSQQAGQLSNHSPSRIVSLSPHITEIVYALGQQDKLIAVSDYCNFPPEAQKKERVGGVLNPNMEKMISLKADLFIGTAGHSELARKLEGQQLKTVLLPNDRLQDIFNTIDSLGNLLDCPIKADIVKDALQDSLLFYQQQAHKLNIQPEALLVIGREPGSARKITASGSDTFLDEIWTLLNGKNSFSVLPAKYAQINREALLNKNPDLIIEFKFNQKWDEERRRKNQLEWSELKNLSAVQYNHIYVLSGDYTLIPGPRIYLLAKDYYKILQKYHKNL